MPFPNEHAARLRDPDDFSSDPSWTDGGGGQFRRTRGGTIFESIDVPETVGIIWGKLPGSDGENDPPVPQALRFQLDSWSPSEAREWLEENEIETVLFEEASGEDEDGADLSFLGGSETVFISPSSEFASVPDSDRPDGKPPRRFWKELIREGSWTHPITGQEFTIGLGHLSRWVRLFGEMSDEGVKVPVNLDHSKKAEDSVGFLKSIEVRTVEGDDGEAFGLFGLIEVDDHYGDKIDQGSIRDVSCAILDRPDSHGSVWKAVVHHVALTVWPVIPGQSGFVRLAGFVIGSREGEGGTMPKPEEGKTKKEDLQNTGAQTPPVNDELELKLSALEAKLSSMELALKEKDEELDELGKKLEEKESEEVSRSKELILATIQRATKEKKIAPSAGDEIVKLTEKLFETELSTEQASTWSALLSGMVDSLQLGTIPSGKISDKDEEHEEETPFKDRELSSFQEKANN